MTDSETHGARSALNTTGAAGSAVRGTGSASFRTVSTESPRCLICSSAPLSCFQNAVIRTWHDVLGSASNSLIGHRFPIHDPALLDDPTSLSATGRHCHQNSVEFLAPTQYPSVEVQQFETKTQAPFYQITRTFRASVRRYLFRLFKFPCKNRKIE